MAFSEHDVVSCYSLQNLTVSIPFGWTSEVISNDQIRQTDWISWPSIQRSLRTDQETDTSLREEIGLSSSLLLA